MTSLEDDSSFSLHLHYSYLELESWASHRYLMTRQLSLMHFPLFLCYILVPGLGAEGCNFSNVLVSKTLVYKMLGTKEA
jgi:hypothetical protein